MSEKSRRIREIAGKLICIELELKELGLEDGVSEVHKALNKMAALIMVEDFGVKVKTDLKLVNSNFKSENRVFKIVKAGEVKNVA